MKYWILTLMILFNCASFAQDYRGLWSGYLTSYPLDVPVLNVQYILHVKDQDQNIVNGKAYVYRSNPLKAEGVLDFIGVTSQGTLKITELKILHSKIQDDSVRFLCIKDLELDLTREDGIENLKGTFRGAGENGIECYPGKAYLQRYSPSNPQKIPDFLLSTILLDGKDPNVFLKTSLARPVVIEVNDNVVQLQIRDYLREDGDIVSVYHNRKIYLRNVNIKNSGTRHTLRLDRSKELHEIIMFAENLGTIPPNTSDLRIFDGEKEHQVLIQASKEVSAVIYLRYVPQKSPSR